MGYAHTQYYWDANRFLGLLVAVAINGMLLYGLATALVLHEPVDTAPPVVVVPVLEEDQPLPPPVAPAQYEPGPVILDPLGPPPMDAIALERDPVVAGPVIVDSGSGAAGSAPIVTELQVDPAYFVKPTYPPRSVALEEEGVVQLLVYVLPDGRVGDVRIRHSSGHARLDQSAVRTVRAKWRFRPRTLDGVPVAGWGTYSVRFELVN